MSVDAAAAACAARSLGYPTFSEIILEQQLSPRAVAAMLGQSAAKAGMSLALQTGTAKWLPTSPLFALLVCAVGGSGEAQAGISLSALSWDIQYSQNMPVHPSTADAGWAFDFPKGTNCSNKYKCPAVHYVTTKYTEALPYKSTLTISGEITVTNKPTFNYQLKSTNTCLSPPNARALIQKKNDDLYDSNGRFWSNPIAIPLVPGKFSVTIPLDIDNWSNVYGKRDKSGMKTLLANMGRIGLTFGGGCFFGHGINVSGGTAKFTVTNFEVQLLPAAQ
jgi:hypothetical protein